MKALESDSRRNSPSARSWRESTTGEEGGCFVLFIVEGKFNVAGVGDVGDDDDVTHEVLNGLTFLLPPVPAAGVESRSCIPTGLALGGKKYDKIGEVEEIDILVERGGSVTRGVKWWGRG